MVSHGDPRMAGARSVNPKVMDTHLAALIQETQAIESQVDGLLKKLESVRAEILAHSLSKEPEAIAKPQTILPVPERPAVTKVKMVKKPVAKPKKVVKANSISKLGVVSVRTGVHKDKTRLVFDVNGSTANTVEFDKELGLLTVSLPKTKWATQTSRSYKFAQLAGYEAKNSGEGSIIALSVKNTSAVKTSTMKKMGAKSARLIVDLIK